MPLGHILTKQALNTLTQLHGELAGKIETNRKSGDKLRAQMVQVEAVIKMLDPEFNARAISAKRRNMGNPWFKRGTLYRAVLDVLRKATEPMTADALAKAVLEGKQPVPSRQQEARIEAAILAALRQHMGKGVERVGALPFTWRLTE
jgi:uncharacterized protein (DUF4415 family)